MNEHADQLREVFEEHEYLAPDAAAVMAGLHQRALAHRRRRRAAQAAGGAAVTAGLIAGAVVVPGLLPARSGQIVQVSAGADPAAAPSATATTPPTTLDQQWAAYFAAGYDYDDAYELARIWKIQSDPGAVKAEAGRRLLAGQDLPIEPGSAPAAPEPAPGPQDAAVNAFFAAGYDYADAEELARLWHTVDPYHAKAEAGRKLLDGQTLPIQP